MSEKNNHTSEISAYDLSEEELMGELTRAIKGILLNSKFGFRKVYEKFAEIHMNDIVAEKDFIERILEHEVFENSIEGPSFKKRVFISAVSIIDEYYSIYYPVYFSN